MIEGVKGCWVWGMRLGGGMLADDQRRRWVVVGVGWGYGMWVGFVQAEMLRHMWWVGGKVWDVMRRA